MKAVVIREHGGTQNLLYEDIETPEPGPGEVLVRVKASGANHLDHDLREGTSGIPHELPHIPGVEGAGVVAKLGSGVTEVKEGDRVCVGYLQSCGVCRMCRAGYDGICLEGKRMGATQWGSHAEYVRLEARHCIPMPDKLDFETAAASLICFPTAWHMTVTLGKVTAGQDVLVNAAGSGVGTCAIQVAKMHGARVIASAGSDKKLALAKELGADALINYETHDLAEETHRHTGGKGADLVIESVGGDVYEKSIKAAAFDATIVIAGGHAGEKPIFDVIEFFRKQLHMHGSHYASRLEIEHVLGLVAEGKLKPVIHTVAPLSDIQNIARMTANRDFFGKMVLVP